MRVKVANPKFQIGESGNPGVLGTFGDWRPVPDPAEHFASGVADLSRLGLHLASPLLPGIPRSSHLLSEPDTLESGQQVPGLHLYPNLD